MKQRGMDIGRSASPPAWKSLKLPKSPPERRRRKRRWKRRNGKGNWKKQVATAAMTIQRLPSASRRGKGQKLNTNARRARSTGGRKTTAALRTAMNNKENEHVLAGSESRTMIKAQTWDRTHKRNGGKTGERMKRTLMMTALLRETYITHTLTRLR